MPHFQLFMNIRQKEINSYHFILFSSDLYIFFGELSECWSILRKTFGLLWATYAMKQSFYAVLIYFQTIFLAYIISYISGSNFCFVCRKSLDAHKSVIPMLIFLFFSSLFSTSDPIQLLVMPDITALEAELFSYSTAIVLYKKQLNLFSYYYFFNLSHFVYWWRCINNS